MHVCGIIYNSRRTGTVCEEEGYCVLEEIGEFLYYYWCGIIYNSRGTVCDDWREDR